MSPCRATKAGTQHRKRSRLPRAVRFRGTSEARWGLLPMKSQSKARRHHWIPESYLGLFSSEGRTGSQVFVVDALERKSFWTSTDNVCVKRDFNRIEGTEL